MSLSAIAEPNLEIVYKLKASIAKVHTVTKSGGQGVGSAVVVAKDHVATNCHVLANSSGINITSFGETFTPVAVKEDWRHDICILKFEYLPLAPVELGDSESLGYEQSVFSIGFPGGPPKPQTTFGNIKALYKFDDSQIIRTSASFVLGASGSPLFDDAGRLVGLDTFKSPGRNAFFYSVPVKWIKALLDAPEHTQVSASGAPFWDAPEDQRPYLMRVVLPAQNAEWKDLQQIAQAWVDKEPDSVEASYYLGLALQKLGQGAQAQSQFERVLQVVPRHTASLIALGEIASSRGDTKETQRLAAIIQPLDNEAAEALLGKQP